MKGMFGSTAQIVSAEQTTVYMIDYTKKKWREKSQKSKMDNRKRTFSCQVINVIERMGYSCIAFFMWERV
ncbi:hypothetical protein ASG65_17965 [Bacillus sp. Leaf13]|nr:hypothetical protein ASG65_17965 [Bacillus sp. Leaf13]